LATPTSLRIAIVSDIHAYDGVEPDQAPSHCCVTENDPTKNPLCGLRELIQKESIRADLHFGPGDHGDKAQPTSIDYAWAKLHELKALLKASRLVATTGNHDIDSRHAYNHHDAKGHLQTLDPKYPLSSERQNDQSWSRHFVTIVRRPYRVVVLNSSAFHGEGRFADIKRHEYEQGRVSDYTLQMLKKELSSVSATPVNLLLCHHHPHPHSELRLGANDLMMGGAELLSALSSGDYGRWLIIHGHKHHPKLEYAAGGASPPIVFAAGSIAAVLYRELQTACRNQFYVLELPIARFSTFGFVGRFTSWDWATGHGWIPAREGSGLPAQGGFGFRGDLDVLAKEVAERVQTPSVQWSVLTAQMPKLDYLLPQDGEQLVKALQRDHGLVTEPDRGFPPIIVGRPQ
jgi:hypothetical protein